MRLSTALVLIPAVIVAAIVAVANRQIVVFSLDPFSGGGPGVAIALPLFVLIFLALFVGVLLGGVAVMLRRPRRRGTLPPPLGEHALPPLDRRAGHEDSPSV